MTGMVGEGQARKRPVALETQPADSENQQKAFKKPWKGGAAA
jgi:hypothetical protein